MKDVERIARLLERYIETTERVGDRIEAFRKDVEIATIVIKKAGDIGEKLPQIPRFEERYALLEGRFELRECSKRAI